MPVTRLSFGVAGVAIQAPDINAAGLGKGRFVWIDIAQPTEEELTTLQDTFNFHPLTIEDCRHFDQRAKVEEYESYLFITMAIPRPPREGGDMEADELHAFLSSEYVVTVHADMLPELGVVRQRLLADKGANKATPDFLFYLITDQLIDRYFPILDTIEEQIDILEDEIIAQPTRSTLTRIFVMKQELIYMRKTAGPARDVFNALAGRRFPIITSRTSLYFRDVHDHLVRIYEIIETARDLLGNALDAYLSVVSNRLNDIMKRLTLIATVFMPLSFIAGFGGINFEDMPFGSTLAFVLFCLSTVFTGVIMVVWFWRQKWMG